MDMDMIRLDLLTLSNPPFCLSLSLWVLYLSMLRCMYLADGLNLPEDRIPAWPAAIRNSILCHGPPLNE